MTQVKWLALALMVPLMACGGRAAEDEIDVAPKDERSFFRRVLSPLDSGQNLPTSLVSQVASMTVEGLPGGVILRAVGLPPEQGYWNARLVRTETDSPAVIAFALQLTPPPLPTRVSTQQSREVLAAIFISDQDLAGVREVQVIGENNVLSRRPSR